MRLELACYGGVKLENTTASSILTEFALKIVWISQNSTKFLQGIYLSQLRDFISIHNNILVDFARLIFHAGMFIILYSKHLKHIG